MIRILDIIGSFFGMILLSPVLLVLGVLGYFDTGSPLFRQTRVGRHQEPFVLLKFRTMKVNTRSVASHLVDSAAVTTYGHFLRRSKLDELPQLWNVFKGEMSLVGPRPSLPNQLELVAERASRGVYGVRPGITGLAQINGIDMSKPQVLADIDQQMIGRLTTIYYLKYIVLTLIGKGRGDRIKIAMILLPSLWG